MSGLVSFFSRGDALPPALLLLRQGGNLILRGGGDLTLRGPASAPSTTPPIVAIPTLTGGALRLVSSLAQFPPVSPATNTANDRQTMQVQETNLCASSITAMKVAVGNLTLDASSTGERGGTSVHQQRVDIWDGTAWNNLTFGGQPTVTLQPGQTAISDLVTLATPIASGATWNWWYSDYSPDNTHPVGRLIWGDYGHWGASSSSGGANTPLAPSAGLHASLAVGGSYQGSTPLAIYGDFATAAIQPTCVIIGDSVAAGLSGGESQSVAKNAFGYLERAIHGNFPVMKMAVPSANFRNFSTENDAARLAILMGGGTKGAITDAFVEFGINDCSTLGAGNHVGSVQGGYFWLAGILAGLGIRVHACLLGPKAASTDGYLTQINQTPDTGCGTNETRQNWNDYLRAHNTGRPVPFCSYVHLGAQTLESGVNTNKWTTDGVSNLYVASADVHPNDAGHAYAAAHGVDLTKVLPT